MAVEDEKVVGMVAYHRHSKSRCEMKRLYVKLKYREILLSNYKDSSENIEKIN